MILIATDKRTTGNKETAFRVPYGEVKDVLAGDSLLVMYGKDTARYTVSRVETSHKLTDPPIPDKNAWLVVRDF